MPELPEVETIARALAGALQGRKLLRAAAYTPRLREPLDTDNLSLAAGRKFTVIRRRAKFIIAETGGTAPALALHLGMTGSLRIEEKDAARRKHDHAEFFLDNGKKLVYNDPRRFGLAKVYPTPAAFAEEYADLGLEPLEKGFSGEWLFTRSRKANTPIKPWIMKQEIVVGVGNIYACESLHRCRISPLRPANGLSRDECANLVREIKTVLKQSIKNGGTTFSDYRQLDGSEGHFVQRLEVYGRTSEPCRHCGAPIARIVQGGRSTFYCPQCQA